MEVIKTFILLDLYSRVVYIADFSKLNQQNISACVMNALTRSYGVSNIYLNYSKYLERDSDLDEMNPSHSVESSLIEGKEGNIIKKS